MTSTRAPALPLMEQQLDAELIAQGADPADFLPLDIGAALDIEGRIRHTPLEKQTKGRFFEQIARDAREVGVIRQPHYVSVRDYPLRDFMQLVADYAPLRYPGVPIREAFRRVGSQAFPRLMNSAAGRVLFVLARRDIRAALRLAPEAYKHNLSHCSVSQTFEAPRQTILEFRDVWNFPDCYHVGVIEGVCRAFGVEGVVRTRVRSACDVDMLVRW